MFSPVSHLSPTSSLKQSSYVSFQKPERDFKSSDVVHSASLELPKIDTSDFLESLAFSENPTLQETWPQADGPEPQRANSDASFFSVLTSDAASSSDSSDNEGNEHENENTFNSSPFEYINVYQNLIPVALDPSEDMTLYNIRQPLVSPTLAVPDIPLNNIDFSSLVSSDSYASEDDSSAKLASFPITLEEPEPSMDYSPSSRRSSVHESSAGIGSASMISITFPRDSFDFRDFLTPTSAVMPQRSNTLSAHMSTCTSAKSEETFTLFDRRGSASRPNSLLRSAFHDSSSNSLVRFPESNTVTASPISEVSSPSSHSLTASDKKSRRRSKSLTDTKMSQAYTHDANEDLLSANTIHSFSTQVSASSATATSYSSNEHTEIVRTAPASQTTSFSPNNRFNNQQTPSLLSNSDHSHNKQPLSFERSLDKHKHLKPAALPLIDTEQVNKIYYSFRSKKHVIHNLRPSPGLANSTSMNYMAKGQAQTGFPVIRKSKSQGALRIPHKENVGYDLASLHTLMQENGNPLVQLSPLRQSQAMPLEKDVMEFDIGNRISKLHRHSASAGSITYNPDNTASREYRSASIVLAAARHSQHLNSKSAPKRVDPHPGLGESDVFSSLPLLSRLGYSENHAESNTYDRTTIVSFSKLRSKSVLASQMGAARLKTQSPVDPLVSTPHAVRPCLDAVSVHTDNRNRRPLSNILS